MHARHSLHPKCAPRLLKFALLGSNESSVGLLRVVNRSFTLVAFELRTAVDELQAALADFEAKHAATGSSPAA